MQLLLQPQMRCLPTFVWKAMGACHSDINRSLSSCRFPVQIIRNYEEISIFLEIFKYFQSMQCKSMQNHFIRPFWPISCQPKNWMPVIFQVVDQFMRYCDDFKLCNLHLLWSFVEFWVLSIKVKGLKGLILKVLWSSIISRVLNAIHLNAPLPAE